MRSVEVLADLERRLHKPFEKWGFGDLGKAGIILGLENLDQAEATRHVLEVILKELQK